MCEAYKSSSIIERIGSQDFGFVILSLVDRLKDDRHLKKFFSTFDEDNLALHQEEFLRAVFSKDDADNKDDHNEEVDTFVLLRYYRLIAMGFNERHYDMIVNHFVEALEDGWVDDQELMGDAVEILNSFRHVFEKKNRRTVIERTLSADSLVSAC